MKSMDIEGQNSGYDFDITYFNTDLSNVFGVKFLLNIIDCFNGKAIIYP